MTLAGAATHVGDGRAITAYDWDTDGDGQFDDASGATPTVTISGVSRLVGLKVTDDQGATGIAYAQTTVTSANSAPSSRSGLPTSI